MRDGPTPALSRILGVDPGLGITGYGVLEMTCGNPHLVEAGVVRGGRGSLEQRLLTLHEGIADAIASFQPTAVAIEELYSHYERPRTAIIMGHARGVICLAAAQAKLPVYHYAATQIKKLLTGNGRAPKAQVQLAVCQEFALAQAPEPPDVADALAIALCHSFMEKNALHQQHKIIESANQSP
ncbi:MAG: crossover junction endodeoxyribonuclease RuvC [Planctomycetota bacterium]|nr:crossover junction endodeoxyribonuclease RuvC [Planctomycetota bacterium]